MKILLIDNNTKSTNLWKKLGREAGFDLKITRYDRINLRAADRFDLIILSGGRKMEVPENRKKLGKEIELIEKSGKPILGVCLGFELIADTFGVHLLYRKKRVTGIEKIRVIKNDPIFGRMKGFGARVAHKYYVRKLPRSLVALAKSVSGVEVFKHRNRFIYGFQFHPEILSEENKGTKIFLNLIRSVKLRKLPRGYAKLVTIKP